MFPPQKPPVEGEIVPADAISNCPLPSLKRPREHCLPLGRLETVGPKRVKLVFDGVVIRRKVSSLGPGVEHQTVEEDSPATEDKDHDGSDADSLFDGSDGNSLFDGSDGNSLSPYGGAEESEGGAEESNGGAEESNGGAEESDGGAEESDGGTEESDGGAEESDGGAEESDGSAEESDGSAEESDGSAEESDSSAEESDSGAEESHCSAEESDRSDSTPAPTRYTYDKPTHTRPIPIPIPKVKKVKMVKKGYVAAVPSKAHTSCTFLGFACHLQSHINTTTGSFPWHETTPCPILSALQFQYTLFGFVCTEHKTVVRPGDFVRHLEISHRVRGKQFKKKDKVALEIHLFESYGISDGTVKFPIPVPPLRDDTGIPGLTPYLAFACPVEGCNVYRKVSADSVNGITEAARQVNLWEHVRQTHGKDVGQKLRNTVVLKRRYIIMPFRGSVSRNEKLATLALPYEEDYRPEFEVGFQPSLEANASFPKQPAPVSADWIHELGWDTWVSETGADTEALMKLICMPSESFLRSYLEEVGAGQRLEIGILAIHRLLEGYLMDANQFVEEKHGDLRAEVTAGSHAHYRLLQPRSYLAYRRPITMTILLLLRVIHLGPTGDKGPLARFPRMLFNNLTSQQLDSAFELYNYITTGNNPTIDPKILLHHTHELLSLLVRQELQSMEKISCVTDITLLLGSLLPDGHYQNTNSLTHDCAMFCHGMAAIVIHSVRLEDSGASSFSPHKASVFKKQFESDIQCDISAATSGGGVDDPAFQSCGSILADGKDQEDVVNDDEEEVVEDLGQEVEAPGSSEVPQSGDDLIDDHVARSIQYQSLLKARKDPTAETPVQPSIFRLMADNRDKFLSPMKPTPYGHCKFVWFKVGKHARGESRAFGFTFTEDGQGMIINDPSREVHQISFSLLGSLARGAIAQAEESIVKCLPDKDCVNDFLCFPWKLITDDLMLPESIFRQSQNKEILEPTLARLLCSLLGTRATDLDGPCPAQAHLLACSSRQLDLAKARSWLCSHDSILSSLTAAFILTCGIPPRDFQFKSFQVDHDASRGYKRSFFIIDKLPAFANPQAKQRDQRVKESLWGMTSAQSHSLLFFLGILKPAYAEVMRMMKIHDPDFDKYIFVHSMPQGQGQTPRFLSGSVINYSLYKHTSSAGIRLTCGVMRNKMTAVYRQFFPWLAVSSDDPGRRSAVDCQAQHQASTSNTHYGRILDIPLALDISRQKALMYVKVSRAIQAIYNMAPPEEDWRDHHDLQKSPYFLAKFNEAAAFAKAQWLVCVHYGLGGACASIENCDRNKKVVENVLSTAPYLHCPTSQPEISMMTTPPPFIGDYVLIQVTHILAYGVHGAPPFSYPPPGGHPVILPSIAVTLIIRALEEWRDGCHKRLDSVHDLKLSQYFDGIQAKAYKWFSSIKMADDRLWVATSLAIHTLGGLESAHHAMTESWIARGVPGHSYITGQ